MAYAYTWDPAAPLNTALVSDGARVMREDIKGALNERLLSVFTNLTSDPLVHSKVLVQATGKVNLDGSAAGDTYIYEQSANVASLVAGGVTSLTWGANAVVLKATNPLYFDGVGGTAGDTYISEVSANILRFYAGGVNTFTISASVAAFGGTSVTLGTTNKLYFDSGTDTYIHESSADTLSFVAGAATQLAMTTTYAQFFQALIVNATKFLYFDGGSDTYITESSANVLKVFVGAVENMNIQSTLTTFNLNVNLQPTKKLSLDGGGDTYIQESSANVLIFVAGGVTGLTLTGTTAILGSPVVDVVLGGAGKKVGFFSQTGTAQVSVTGAKAGNVALANLMTALAGYGLVTDATT